MSQHSYNTSCVFSLVVRYSERVKRMKAKLVMAANVAAERARSDVEIIGGLWEQVNPMYDKVEKLTEAMERAHLLHEEGQRDMKMVKKKLYL